MKKLLGSLVFAISVFAQDTYNVHLSTLTPQVKEPILVTLSLFNKTKKHIAWLEFAPKNSDAYEIKLLNKKEKDGKFIHTFLLFPLRSQHVSVPFTLKYQKSSDEEINNDIQGQAEDRTKYLQGIAFDIAIPPSTLNVQTTTYKGEVSLNVEYDKTSTQSYEPVYVRISLKGTGYPPENLELFPTIDGVKILKDKPLQKISYTLKGAVYVYTYNYALIATKDFTIPQIRYKGIVVDKKSITVTPASIKKDKKTSPPSLVPFYKELIYLVIFLAGSISGYIISLLLKRKKKRFEKIKDTKNAKELIRVLSVKYPRQFEKEIEILQEVQNVDLKKIKQEIIKRLSHA